MEQAQTEVVKKKKPAPKKRKKNDDDDVRMFREFSLIDLG